MSSPAQQSVTSLAWLRRLIQLHQTPIETACQPSQVKLCVACRTHPCPPQYFAPSSLTRARDSTTTLTSIYSHLSAAAHSVYRIRCCGVSGYDIISSVRTALRLYHVGRSQPRRTRFPKYNKLLQISWRLLIRFQDLLTMKSARSSKSPTATRALSHSRYACCITIPHSGLIFMSTGQDNSAKAVRLCPHGLAPSTDPCRYCVRPNSGVVKPGSSVDVQGMYLLVQHQPAVTLICCSLATGHERRSSTRRKMSRQVLGSVGPGRLYRRDERIDIVVQCGKDKQGFYTREEDPRPVFASSLSSR